MYKKKKEFSKIIFAVVLFQVNFVTLFACLMIFITRDMDSLSYLIPAVFAEFATVTGFYYNKAKEENKMKIKKAAKDYEEQI